MPPLPSVGESSDLEVLIRWRAPPSRNESRIQLPHLLSCNERRDGSRFLLAALRCGARADGRDGSRTDRPNVSSRRLVRVATQKRHEALDSPSTLDCELWPERRRSVHPHLGVDLNYQSPRAPIGGVVGGRAIDADCEGHVSCGRQTSVRRSILRNVRSKAISPGWSGPTDGTAHHSPSRSSARRRQPSGA